jgi:hypothetical protein
LSLRKRPAQTPAFRTAQRLNSLKSTGPRSVAGKARSSLNALKHGRFAHGLPDKLLAAGKLGEAALYASIQRTYESTFGIVDAKGLKQAVQFANTAYVLARQAQVLRTKPECSLFSARLGPQSLSLFRFRVTDPRFRVGLVFWVQRKGYWNWERLAANMLQPGSTTAEPPLGHTLENRLRHRAYRMYRPGSWEREAYGLDECGCPDPKRKPRRDLQRILGRYAGRWSEISRL